MEIAPNITVAPNIHHGPPVITGTHVPAEIIVGTLASGMSKTEVMAEYDLTQPQVTDTSKMHTSELELHKKLNTLEKSLTSEPPNSRPKEPTSAKSTLKDPHINLN